MKHYKGHPVYGLAVPQDEKRWSSRGLVFDPDLNQTVAIQRIDSATDLTFKTKHRAEEHGLILCKEWIDGQAQSVTQEPLATKPDFTEES
jgi:hypothetical protein